jgi:acyl-CoA synthetase (AMP-forming)/AMP-acid ligase II
MLDDLIQALEQGVDLSNLQAVNFQGGGVAQTRLMDLARYAPHLTLTFGYGLSETFGSVAVGGGASSNTPFNGGVQVLPTVEVRIMGPDNEALRPGARGRIHLRGRMLATGYCTGVPGLTRGKWFDSGDIGWVEPDGTLFLLDRAQHCLTLPDAIVSAAELEAVALAAPEVLHAVALVDQAACKVVLRVAPRSGRTIAVEALEASFAEFSNQVKVKVEVVAATSLIRSASGKLLRVS